MTDTWNTLDRQRVQDRLKWFIVRDVVRDDDTVIDDTTPLWDWGLIDSFSMFAILAFVEKELGIEIPPDEPTADDFRNVVTLADLVLRKRA